MKISLSLALLGAVALTAAPHAFAQTDAPTKPATAEVAKARMRSIVLKNLDARAMAYWLDPVHNPNPMIVGQQLAAVQSRSLAPSQSVVALPASVERVFGTSPRTNRLMVVGGSDEDVQKLRQIVESLDNLVRQDESGAQIEIEVLVVDISSAALKTLMPDDRPGKANLILDANMMFSGDARSDFRARLDALVANGDAKIISTPRVTAFENTSVLLDLVGPDNQDANAPLRSLTARVSPAINGDGTLSVTIKAETNRNTGGASSVSNGKSVAAGATMLLTGLTALVDPPQTSRTKVNLSDIPTIGKLFKAPRVEAERHIALFLTPRIVAPRIEPMKTN